MRQGRLYTTAIVISVLTICLFVLGARWHALGQRVPLGLPRSAAVSLAKAQSDAPRRTSKQSNWTNEKPASKSRSARTATAAPDPAPANAADHQAGPIDINTATAAQLEQLPGIGPVLAQRIVEYRKAHGMFKSLQGLLDVSGIGEKKLAALTGQAVCSGGD